MNGVLLRKLLRRPSTALSIAWLVIVAVATVFPKAFTRIDQDEQDLLLTLKGPTHGHVLGTDQLGRDLTRRA